MKIYVPYTQLSEATRVFLYSPFYTPCPVVMVDCTNNEWGYQEYMEKVWELGESFINLEHDIVPWPGAIQELVTCPYPWCTYGYQPLPEELAANGASYFGLTRFRESIISGLPHVWEERRTKEWIKGWLGMDTHFFSYATQRGYWPHEHRPSVLNANPKIFVNEPMVPTSRWVM